MIDYIKRTKDCSACDIKYHILDLKSFGFTEEEKKNRYNHNVKDSCKLKRYQILHSLSGDIKHWTTFEDQVKIAHYNHFENINFKELVHVLNETSDLFDTQDKIMQYIYEDEYMANDNIDLVISRC